MEPKVKYSVPQEKLGEVLAAAFDLSRPQGLGFLHYKPGSADAEMFRDDIKRAIAADTSKPFFKSIHLDYVQGCACKFSIRYDADGWFVEGPRWYDHSPEALLELVNRCGLKERVTA